MKKILISSLVALILTFSTLGSYQKASAASWADVPGYADEAFKAMISGFMAVGGAAAHAGNYVEDNLKAIVDGAGLTYDQLAPHAKQAFNDALSASADGTVVAGDWITSFLDSFKPSGVDTSDYFHGYEGGYYSLTNGHMFDVSGWPGAGTNYYRANAVVMSNNYMPVATIEYMGIYASSVEKVFESMEARDAFASRVSDLLYSGDVHQFLQGIAMFGISVSIIGADGSVVIGGDLPTGQLDNIRTELDKLRNADGTMRLGVPAHALVEPWANVGGINQRVYYDQTQDLWTLPDGTPIPRDQIQVKPRAQGMYGDTPVVVGSDGALYDLRTGDRVATREDAQAKDIPISTPIAKEWEWQDTITKNPEKDKVEDKPISIPGGFAAPTKPIAWTALKMNAQALTTKFPFSIPWDLLRQLKVFDVGPETPVFEVNIGDYLKIGDYTIPMNFEIDLKMFDKVAAFIRWFNLILWDIGLVLLIRKLLPE